MGPADGGVQATGSHQAGREARGPAQTLQVLPTVGQPETGRHPGVCPPHPSPNTGLGSKELPLRASWGAFQKEELALWGSGACLGTHCSQKPCESGSPVVVSSQHADAGRVIREHGHLYDLEFVPLRKRKKVLNGEVVGWWKEHEPGSDIMFKAWLSPAWWGLAAWTSFYLVFSSLKWE